MAITTLFNTGFEHGVASAQGAGLISSITGAGTSVVISGSPRHGNGNLHIVGPGATIEAWQATFAVAQTKLVSRFAIKLSSRPPSGFANLAFAGATWTLRALPTGQLNMILSGNTATGPIIDTTSWHLIEVQIDVSANPWVLSWKVDGVLQTGLSPAVAASTIANQALGEVGTAGAAFTCDYDDWIVGSYTAAGTDWYGNGGCLGYGLLSDGTHLSPTLFSPGDAGTAFTAGITSAFTHLNSLFSTARSTTSNLAQRTTGLAYLEGIIGGASESGFANVVSALLSYSAPTTTADNASCIAFNSAGGSSNTGNVVVWGDFPTANGGQGGAQADYSESSNFFKRGIIPAPAAGWTNTEVNKIKFRFGNSSDISPVPTMQGGMVEVDWPILPRPLLRRSPPTINAPRYRGRF